MFYQEKIYQIYEIKSIKTHYNFFIKLCLWTFWTIPIIDIKTMSDVLPAEMNGNGNPVGGTTPVTTAMFRRVWIKISEPIPAESKAPNLSFAFKETLMIATKSLPRILLGRLFVFNYIKLA